MPPKRNEPEVRNCVHAVRRANMYEENILSVRLDDITIITPATCGSASFFFNVETRDRDIAIHHRDKALRI